MQHTRDCGINTRNGHAPIAESSLCLEGGITPDSASSPSLPWDSMKICKIQAV